MRRIANIMILLSVYLVWICGNSFVAISCHANRSNNSNSHSCCAEVCDCHHHDWQAPHFESPHRCFHDHSNRVVLYDNNSKNEKIDIAPVVLSITAQIADNISIEEKIELSSSLFYEHHTPLPDSPTSIGCGMRAPPVVA